eukprot:3060607-Amphidinium_carterae.2
MGTIHYCCTCQTGGEHCARNGHAQLAQVKLQANVQAVACNLLRAEPPTSRFEHRRLEQILSKKSTRWNNEQLSHELAKIDISSEAERTGSRARATQQPIQWMTFEDDSNGSTFQI